MVKAKPETCVICGRKIPVFVWPNGYKWRHGCNADPVAPGRCCIKCDREKVIPARLAGQPRRFGPTIPIEEYERAISWNPDAEINMPPLIVMERRQDGGGE